MIDFVPLEAIDAARSWRNDHSEHVQRVVDGSDDKVVYPPSGSDMYRSELWKAAHWRWLEAWGKRSID